MGKISYLGHSAFEVLSGGKTIFVDPWLTGNPAAAKKVSEISAADLILVTHDHGDHGLQDAIEIATRTKAILVGIYELAVHATSMGVKDSVGLNIGGTANIKGVNVTMVQAFHSSGKGSPVGFIFDAGEGGIYHLGDTSLFQDMKLIGEVYKPKIALVPVGGYYTMGPEEAAIAVSLIKPKVAIPMHYKTFPVLAQTAERFVKHVKEKAPEVKSIAIKPGESYEF